MLSQIPWAAACQLKAAVEEIALFGTVNVNDHATVGMIFLAPRPEKYLIDTGAGHNLMRMFNLHSKGMSRIK